MKFKRKFGKFNCSCGRSWASGNTWVGKWQKCEKCNAEVMPVDIQPLRPHRAWFGAKKPHESSLCEQCIELGYNCQEYNDDIPDDESIISEASTASSSSLAEEQNLSDDNLTPVASDEEEQESFLDSKLKNLHINKDT